MQTPSSDRQANGWLLASAAALYLVLVTWAEWVHTLWRDEAEAWIVARESHGWLSLLHNARYEGHPPAWYAVLYGLTRFTTNVEWMKLPNLLFAVAAAWMILAATRPAWPIRVGLIFSYYLFFEYAVIDRNYMLGIVCLTAAITWMRRERSAFAVPVLLSLAALSSLPALIVAVCLYPLHLLPDLATETPRTLGHRLRTLGAARFAAMLLFTLSVLAALAEIRPPADSGLMLDSLPRTSRTNAVARVFHDVSKAYLPLPPLQVAFWNKFAADGFSPRLYTLIGIALAVGLCLFFRQRMARGFFLAATVLLVAQMAMSRRSEARHVGWLFVVFALALLLESVPWLRTTQSVRSGWRAGLLYGVLAVQVFAGFFAILVSTHHTFSGSRDAARFLRSQGLDTQPMIFAPDYVSLPVIAYLQRPSAYYLDLRGPGAVVVWNKSEFYKRHMPSREEMIAASQGGPPAVLITEHPLSAAKIAELGVHQLAVTTGEIDTYTFFIYR